MCHVDIQMKNSSLYILFLTDGDTRQVSKLYVYW